MITFTPTGETESIAVPINKETLTILQKKLDEAKLTKQETITVSGLDHPFSISDAERIVQTFTEVNTGNAPTAGFTEVNTGNAPTAGFTPVS